MAGAVYIYRFVFGAALLATAGTESSLSPEAAALRSSCRGTLESGEPGLAVLTMCS